MIYYHCTSWSLLSISQLLACIKRRLWPPLYSFSFINWFGAVILFLHSYILDALFSKLPTKNIDIYLLFSLEYDSFLSSFLIFWGFDFAADDRWFQPPSSFADGLFISKPLPLPSHSASKYVPHACTASQRQASQNVINFLLFAWWFPFAHYYRKRPIYRYHRYFFWLFQLPALFIYFIQGLISSFSFGY